MTESVPDAWVAMPDEVSLRAQMPGENPYDFGFLPAMARLIFAHPAIGRALGLTFVTIMFGPGALTRREREMVAGVTAAAQDCFY